MTNGTKNFSEHAHHHSRRKRIAFSAVNVIAPPISARFHGRYDGRPPHHLFFDTLLALVIIFLIGANIVFLNVDQVQLPVTVGVTFTTPKEVTSGDLATATLTLTRETEAMKEVTFTLAPPEQFLLRSSSRSATAENPLLWELPTPAEFGSSSLSIVGQVIGSQNTTVEMRGLLQYRIDGLLFSKTVIANSRVVDTHLSLRLEAPSSGTTDETYTATVSLHNTGSEAFKNIELRIAHPSATLLSPAPTKENDSWIIEELKAGAVFTVQITVQPSAPGTHHFMASVLAQARTTSVQQGETLSQNVVVTEKPSIGEVIETPETGEIQFAAQALYTSSAGVQLGYGPLPPRVGETTGYRIFWVVRSPEDLRNGTVTAKLPPGVEWGENATVSHGDGISYAPSSRSIRWALGALTAAEGSLSGSFEVTLTPGASDVGKVLTLLHPSLFSAERENGARISKTAPAILGDLPGTEDASGAVLR